MVGFRDLVGTDFAPVSNKTAVKSYFQCITRNSNPDMTLFDSIVEGKQIDLLLV